MYGLASLIHHSLFRFVNFVVLTQSNGVSTQTTGTTTTETLHNKGHNVGLAGMEPCCVAAMLAYNLKLLSDNAIISGPWSILHIDSGKRGQMRGQPVHYVIYWVPV